jgi:hypothetical protein
MGNSLVEEKVCDAKMETLQIQLGTILNNTNDIKESIRIMPILIDRVTQLEKWRDGFWKTVIITMAGTLAIFSGVIALITKFNL